jgi:UDP-glucose 4-epimerase
MRILVTGGAGFIGSHLTARLVDGGHDVFVLDNLSTGTMKNLSHIQSRQNLKVLRADIRRIPRSLLRRLRRIDGVCHLAAMTSVQESVKNPVPTTEVNLVGTLRVLEAARKLRAERIVYGSSAAVYGTPRSFPITEDADVAPISPYGSSKAASELYCKAFEENHGIEAISLRYFNVYGPRQASSQYGGVISIFARKLLRRLPLTIFDDGSQSRDFVFVLDAIDGTIAALEKESLQSRVFNIASGKETTILELARMMQEIVGASSDLIFKPPCKGDVRRSVADVARAQDEMGFRPATDLRDGLSATIQWFAHKK